MKKLPFILLFLPALLWAKPVSMNQVQQIAERFVNSTDGSLITPSVAKLRHLKRVAKQATDNPPYYIFNNEEGGFVIIAGDDCATPILGYSNEGSIDLDNMPIQLEELLNAYALEIQEAVDNNLQATEEVTESWNEFNRAPQTKKTTAVISALISTKWNQYPRYNALCPSDASLSSLGGHPTTGCVATAMAQIMKYWEYPKKGYGSKSYRSDYYGTLYADFGSTAYDWENMPIQLSSSTSSAQNNAVATLMYHCGVAVSMGYNSDGKGSSGAYVISLGYGRTSAEEALKTYFGYAATLSGQFWGQSTSTATWSSMLKKELDNKRPILYAGYSPNGGGHAFICDGYDSSNKFHFNWGWGGQANGYFSLTALTPGNYNFSEGQQAVIGIAPKDGSSPAKKYDLYMNTDLDAINTSSSSSSEPNAYYFGNTMSFTAKVENNGTGAFNGNLKVAAFTDEGEFIAWSNESYHFTLEAGKNTEKKTYTFTGGMPFLPGKYRAYMYYQDDDETESKLVKTDEGIFLTEYNNVAFTVKAAGNLQPISAYTCYDQAFDNIFVTGQRALMGVEVKNTSSSKFNGKIRLSILNLDGTLAQVIEEYDLSNTGIPANSTYTFSFYNIIDVATPGTYKLTLLVKSTNQSTWAYMGCTTTHPNPVSVIVQAPALRADDFEPNNTESAATTLPWDIDPEVPDFEASYVSLHADTDIDYYKLLFPEGNKYEINVHLYDKYNQGGLYYENADAQFAYSIGGDAYSGYYKNSETITFNGPTTLYFRVKPYGMSGLGYYELSGEIEETILDDIENVHVDGDSPTKVLHEGQFYIIRGEKVYTMMGQEVK